MKSRKLFAMAAATLVLGLLSCVREESNSPLVADEYDVTLSFRNVSTRADSQAATPGAIVGIYDGYLCFVSANEAITDVYRITAGATLGKNINRDQLGATPVELKNIPAASVKVYMIANVNLQVDLPAPVVGGNMTTFMAKTMTIEEVEPDYTRVTSTGNAVLAPDAASTNARKADITLSTKISRIQIESINFAAGISGTVAGIFINGFYYSMQFNGTPSALMSTTDPLKYYENGLVDNPLVFSPMRKGKVFDNVSKPIASVVTPNNGAWGYNLFTSPSPQIVIKLTGVAIAGQSLASSTQYVTVHGFKNSGGVPITTIEGGMIYTIKVGSLVIKYEHMSLVPGVTPMDVEITVSPVTWQETIIIPDL